MTQRRGVLLVDDNADLVDNMSEILGDAGYDVRRTGRYADAEAMAQKEGFDVAVVDVRLPDGDGTVLARRLKQIDADGQVILMTGFASLESAVAAVRSGAWAYLVKPCPVPDLLLAIEQAVNQVALLEERRELARRAIVAEKLAAVGTLTAGLSHEIRNPLNAAALQLTVLERRIRRVEPGLQEALREPLDLVQHEVRRLNRILDEFLQFARPRELAREPVDLPTLLGHVLDLLGPEAERGGLRLERRIAALPSVAGDPTRLEQAVMNLVLNALQATPAGGAVRVSAATDGQWVELIVEDSGPGISEELRERVLEPFFTTKQAGSGLGLPLVHTIVQQHSGSLTIDTSDLGGARIVVRLPVTPEQ